MPTQWIRGPPIEQVLAYACEGNWKTEKKLEVVIHIVDFDKFLKCTCLSRSMIKCKIEGTKHSETDCQKKDMNF